MQSGDIRYCPTWDNPPSLNNATIIAGTTITTNATPTSVNSITFQGDAILQFNGTNAVNFGSSTNSNICANTQTISTGCQLVYNRSPYGTTVSSNTVAIKNLSSPQTMNLSAVFSFGSGINESITCYIVSYTVYKNGTAIISKNIDFANPPATGEKFSIVDFNNIPSPYCWSLVYPNASAYGVRSVVYTYTFTNTVNNGDVFSIVMNNITPKSCGWSTPVLSSYGVADLSILPFF